MALDESATAYLQKLDTRHHVHDYLKTIGASDDAAALIASSEQVRQFEWNGAVLTWKASGEPAAHSSAAKEHFTKGPFKTLFASGKDPGGHKDPQLDPALVDAARGGNLTARGRLLRTLNGDVEALNGILAAQGNADGNLSNGHDSTNPFLRLRDPRTGGINTEVQQKISGMIRSLGTAKVTAIAKAVGMTLSGLPLPR
jgi:hypothetical protein